MSLAVAWCHTYYVGVASDGLVQARLFGRRFVLSKSRRKFERIGDWAFLASTGASRALPSVAAGLRALRNPTEDGMVEQFRKLAQRWKSKATFVLAFPGKYATFAAEAGQIEIGEGPELFALGFDRALTEVDSRLRSELLHSGPGDAQQILRGIVGTAAQSAPQSIGGELFSDAISLPSNLGRHSTILGCSVGFGF